MGIPGFPVNSFDNLLHQTWCGSAGWLPGFPWLTRALGVTGISLPDAGLLISWLAMGAAPFSPGSDGAEIFGRDEHSFCSCSLASSPDRSTARVLPDLTRPGLHRRRSSGCGPGEIFHAALLMSLAGLSYPSAWFAAAGLAIGLVLAALSLGWAVLIRRMLWGIAGLSSLLVLGIHDQLAFGHFNAFFVMDSDRAFALAGSRARIISDSFSRTTQTSRGAWGDSVARCWPSRVWRPSCWWQGRRPRRSGGTGGSKRPGSTLRWSASQ